MQVLFTLVLSLAALFLISSCGLQGAATPVLTPVESSDPPASFGFTDANCQSRRPPDFGTNNRLGNLDLFLTDGQETLPTKTDLKEVLIENSLQSALVRETVYATKYERTCDFMSGGAYSNVTGFRIECPGSNGYRSIVGGSRVKMCKKKIEVKRDTVESAALNSIHLLNKAHSFFKFIVRGQKIELPQLLLEIFPEYASIYRTRDDMGFEDKPTKKYMFHNVLYWPRHNTISVMPESSTAYEHMQLSSQPFYHLWESAFVFGHELGHHIQFAIAPELRYCSKATWNSFSHQFAAMNDDDSPSEDAVSKKLARICSGLSEAFADLFSHYSLNGSTTSYEANELLFPARSAVEDKINTRTEKILTDGVMEMFLDKGFDSETARRTDVDFTDSHLVGSVFAYAINQLFATIQSYSTLFEDNPQARDPYKRRYVARAKWLLQFLNKFKNVQEPIVAPNTSYNVYLAPVKVTLEASLDTFILQAQVTGTRREQLKKKLCMISQDLLPAMPPVFGSYCH